MSPKKKTKLKNNLKNSTRFMGVNDIWKELERRDKFPTWTERLEDIIDYPKFLWQDIRFFFLDIANGLESIKLWFDVVWNDRPWDSHHLLSIIEVKLLRYQKYDKKYNKILRSKAYLKKVSNKDDEWSSSMVKMIAQYKVDSANLVETLHLIEYLKSEPYLMPFSKSKHMKAKEKKKFYNEVQEKYEYSKRRLFQLLCESYERWSD